MSRVAVIGESTRTAGFALVGALVLPAETQDEALAVWSSLPVDVAVLVLTSRAAAWLGAALRARHEVLLVVMPP
jgi:vacuolar-type H+-ATPase subunit F/Vma7